MTTIAYCNASGALHFGPTTPEGFLPVARCPAGMDREVWRSRVEMLCRRAYNIPATERLVGRDPIAARENGLEPLRPRIHGKASAYVIPGIPEAPDQIKGVEALHLFAEVLFQAGLDAPFPNDRRKITPRNKTRACNAFRKHCESYVR